MKITSLYLHTCVDLMERKLLMIISLLGLDVVSNTLCHIKKKEP